MKAYLEISPLFEDHWTGIPVVTAAVAAHALEDTRIEWNFLFETVPLPQDMVVDMLQARTGAVARGRLPDLFWRKPPLSWAESKKAPAIYTNIKPMRRYFRREAMIIYDLSPVLTPQFHNVDTINHFGNRLRGDIETTEHFFCISNATERDLQSYLGVDCAQTSLIRLGIDICWIDVSMAQRIADEREVEPYVVVLGTLEPRKNGQIVLRYLAAHPEFARRCRVVFVGREGWLAERDRLMGDLIAHGISPDRVLFTGYLTEQEKIMLIYNSLFCIYPSFFEGFGLPVLETIALGKIMVCSNTSSMPEVMPEHCCFFDPHSLSEFGRAMAAAETEAGQQRGSRSLTDVMGQVDRFDWSECYAEIARWVLA